MFTYEIADLFHVSRLSGAGISHLADNIVLLQYVRNRADLKRTLTIVKARASSTATTTREFRISTGGIMLGEPIESHPRDSGKSPFAG
jgi:circadian clock protein KaiC